MLPGEARTGPFGHTAVDHPMAFEVSGGRDKLIVSPGWSPRQGDQMAFRLVAAGNTVSIAQNKSVTIVNASLVFEPEDRKWNITLSGNNLTDRVYPLAGTSSESTSAGYAEVIYARPRSVTLTYSINF